MAITIIKKNEVIKTENIIVTLYGQPGIGKTSYALTSKNPILFDFDKGMQRALLRADCLPIDNWQQIDNLTENDLLAYDTIVIDTVGRLLEVLALYLIKGNAKLGRGTGELTLQGYGALNAAFKAWMGKIKSYKKNIILIGHAKESTKNDNTIVRIDAVGSSKDEIFKISDLMGYMEFKDGNRVINFDPTEYSLGKNCAGIKPIIVPHISVGSEFMGDEVTKTLGYMNELSAEQTELLNQLSVFKEQLNNTSKLDDVNSLVDSLKFDIKNTNNHEMKKLLHNHAINLGFIFDKDKSCYVAKVIEPVVDIPLVSDEIF